ncbi:hypothetical protein DQX05_21045 [Paenibacillus thiaminolyticus]|uniref:Uncharacterized protein n=1 Tax=Paenibacillus thiaminolyticus TaxID=49283 RepID=A0A3A3GBT5_PANTH|nr:hypothetical protein DQX05_22950 [Paenibacillus thiaminolyticus]RJG21523.1 hypothetical protein DQX05_21045 [Paenibacillus thiaminolyticus]
MTIRPQPVPIERKIVKKVNIGAGKKKDAGNISFPRLFSFVTVDGQWFVPEKARNMKIKRRIRKTRAWY